MKYNQKIGRFGEELARKYLKRKGYKIINTNLKIGYNELDIICEHKKNLVFVEVKTRASEIFGQANEAVFRKKTESLKRAVGAYLNLFARGKYYQDIRLDLISIDINKPKKTAKIKHYQGIA